MTKNLFERLGGEAAIMTVVDVFYKKVLDDPLTASYFDDIDMSVQARKQVAFLMHAFDGPEQFRGRGLREAHAELTLDDRHFDAVAIHLRDTLDEIGVEGDLIDEVLTIVGNTRAEVLGS